MPQWCHSFSHYPQLNTVPLFLYISLTQAMVYLQLVYTRNSWWRWFLYCGRTSVENSADEVKSRRLITLTTTLFTVLLCAPSPFHTVCISLPVFACEPSDVSVCSAGQKEKMLISQWEQGCDLILMHLDMWSHKHTHVSEASGPSLSEGRLTSKVNLEVKVINTEYSLTESQKWNNYPIKFNKTKAEQPFILTYCHVSKQLTHANAVENTNTRQEWGRSDFFSGPPQHSFSEQRLQFGWG